VHGQRDQTAEGNGEDCLAEHISHLQWLTFGLCRRMTFRGSRTGGCLVAAGVE
jgi:hypothetical protein